MKFFTRDWCQGEMTDEEAESVVAAYRRHLERSDLPDALWELARVNPHDALILDVEHEPRERTLKLRLRCGDLQTGYFDLLLVFTHAILSSIDEATLLAARHPAKLEILHDEVDRVASDAFEYRLLLHPAGEVCIRFNRVTTDRRRVEHREP